MAEYYTVLKRAVAGLDPNVADARRAVYDKARNALIGQLKAVEPPLTTAEISRQRLELEEAIRKVERETAAGVVGAAAAPPPPPQRAQRQPPPPPRPAPQYEPEPLPEPVAEAGQPTPQDVFRRAMQEAGMRGAEAGARMERPPPRGRAPEPPADMRLPPEPPYQPPPDPGYRQQDQAYRQDGYRPELPYRDQQPYRQEQPPQRGYPPPPPPRQDYRQPDPGYPPEPAYPPADRAAAAPRLAPEYDQDWDRGDRGGPAPAPVPSLDRRERPGAARNGRKRGYLEGEEQETLEREPRKSRLPGIILFILIIGVIGGLGALGWSQRAMVMDLLASIDTSFGSGGGGSGDAPTTRGPAAGPVAASDDARKNADRLLDGGAPPAGDPPRDVRVVQPDDPGEAAEDLPDGADNAVALAPPVDDGDEASGDSLVAQKAILYEEPLEGAGGGVTAINAAVTWKFVENGPNGPELEASLDVPERQMKIKFSLHKNSDQSLPASHLIEVVVDTPADFPGKAIRSVPRVVLKPTEESRGQALAGADAKVADGFFWIALSAAPDDVTANLALLKERNWIDLPLVYENGQRAILTFEKGTPGERVINRAVAAWEG